MSQIDRTALDGAPDAPVPWWREAVIYQVYVRSFADAGGDGIGDLDGVRAHLAYIRDLGVDALWLNPFYPSPQADAGYDVADYRDVDPRFGTLATFDALVAEAHRLAVRVIVDLVPNHTSDEHPWFRAALAASPGSRERARYLFRDGQGPGGDEPPSNWQSRFGGRAWTRVTEPGGRPGQWYLHLFDAKQPDLDWTNGEVRAEFASILRFWLDRGVDGFRIDVAHGLAKDPDLTDVSGPHADPERPASAGHPHWDRDEVHDVYRSWRRIIDSYPGEPAFVGEVWVDSPERLARYLRPGELHSAFNFHFLLAPWSAEALRGAIDASIAMLAGVGAPTTWVLSNHDVTRHLTRYGGGPVGERRARASALLMLALPGGAYIYQGDELGLPEVEDLPDEARADPTFRRSGGTDKGRDGARIPLPWAGDTPPFGFSPAGATAAPWLPQPADWASRTVAREEATPDSMLSLYRSALRWRRRLPALGDGTLTWVDDGRLPPSVLAFTREPGFLGVVNAGPDPVDLPAEVIAGRTPILASAVGAAGRRLAPDSAAWFVTDAARGAAAP